MEAHVFVQSQTKDKCSIRVLGSVQTFINDYCKQFCAACRLPLVLHLKCVVSETVAVGLLQDLGRKQAHHLAIWPLGRTQHPGSTVSLTSTVLIAFVWVVLMCEEAMIRSELHA